MLWPALRRPLARPITLTGHAPRRARPQKPNHPLDWRRNRIRNRVGPVEPDQRTNPTSGPDPSQPRTPRGRSEGRSNGFWQSAVSSLPPLPPKRGERRKERLVPPTTRNYYRTPSEQPTPRRARNVRDPPRPLPQGLTPARRRLAHCPLSASPAPARLCLRAHDLRLRPRRRAHRRRVSLRRLADRGRRIQPHLPVRRPQ
jgi:hypothetical protein